MNPNDEKFNLKDFVGDMLASPVPGMAPMMPAGAMAQGSPVGIMGPPQQGAKGAPNIMGLMQSPNMPGRGRSSMPGPQPSRGMMPEHRGNIGMFGLMAAARNRRPDKERRPNRASEMIRGLMYG